jgi:hypothetical protein
VNDIAASTRRAIELSGRTADANSSGSSDVGGWTVLIDPDGNRFGIFHGGMRGRHHGRGVLAGMKAHKTHRRCLPMRSTPRRATLRFIRRHQNLGVSHSRPTGPIAPSIFAPCAYGRPGT